MVTPSRFDKNVSNKDWLDTLFNQIKDTLPFLNVPNLPRVTENPARVSAEFTKQVLIKLIGIQALKHRDMNALRRVYKEVKDELGEPLPRNYSKLSDIA